MPHISIARLKEVVIPYGSQEFQKQFVESQKANIIASERSKVEERIRALGYEEEIEQKESDIVRTLVHELRPKLSKINVFAEKLTRLAKAHNLEELKEYSEDIKLNVDPDAETPENLTLKEVTNKLLDDSKKLNEILATVKEVMSFNLDETDFIQTDLFAFIHDYIKVKRLEINNAYTMEIKGSQVEIDIHKDSMHIVLDQLIANAEKHGFTSKPKKYTIDFRIKRDEERQVAIIEYSNNG
jgi:signal transduction histidine kinase